MSIKSEYLSPCGMYCSVCSIRYAQLNNDQELKLGLARFFGTEPENITCEGCRSDKKFQFAETCNIRKCSMEKKLEGCHLCADFPCRNIRSFPFEIAVDGMLEAVPRWRELGAESWVAELEKQYTCSQCGMLLHRHARQCNNCRTPFTKAAPSSSD